jgi:hypothetical protein
MIIYQGPKVDFPTIVATQRAAARQRPYTGHGENLERLGFTIVPLKAQCLFTLDTGYHASGWWKNPDYDTCWHLTISYHEMERGELLPQDHKTSWRIVRAFFEANHKFVWSEPPFTADGKKYDVWHYRLFIDRATGLALFPRGEVYSRELTEKGWKSFSELQSFMQKQKEEGFISKTIDGVETRIILGKGRDEK